MSEYICVRDYRTLQLLDMPNVVNVDLPLRHERIDFAAEPTATGPALHRREQIE